MKSVSTYFNSEKGLTLIEILASIVILSIIIVSLLTMFVQSSRSNSFSKKIVDATYVAETQMEEINNLNTSPSSTSMDSLSTLIINSGFPKIDNGCPTGSTCFAKDKSGHYVFIQLSNISTDLGKSIVKIYFDNTKTKQEAQMEMLLSWKK